MIQYYYNTNNFKSVNINPTWAVIKPAIHLIKEAVLADNLASNRSSIATISLRKSEISWCISLRKRSNLESTRASARLKSALLADTCALSSSLEATFSDICSIKRTCSSANVSADASGRPAAIRRLINAWVSNVPNETAATPFAIKISELNSTAAIIAYSHDLTVLPNSGYDADIAASTANRFDDLDHNGAEPPELTKSCGFFYAHCTANCFMVGRVGEPQGSPVPLCRFVKPVRSAPLFDDGVVGINQYNGALPC